MIDVCVACVLLLDPNSDKEAKKGRRQTGFLMSSARVVAFLCASIIVTINVLSFVLLL